MKFDFQTSDPLPATVIQADLTAKVFSKLASVSSIPNAPAMGLGCFSSGKEINRLAKFNGGALIGTRVKMVGAQFLEADNSRIEGIPGIIPPPNPSDYTAVEVDPRHTAINPPQPPNTAPLGLQYISDWSGFTITDSDQSEMTALFVPSKSLGQDLARLRRGQLITVYGTVIAMSTPGEFGIICDKIVPESAPADGQR